MPISHPPCLVTSRLLPPVESLGALGVLKSLGAIGVIGVIGVIEVMIEIGCAHCSLLTTHYSLLTAH